MNRYYFCQKEEESVNYLFLRCDKVNCIWDLVFNIFSIKWVMANSVENVFRDENVKLSEETRKKCGE